MLIKIPKAWMMPDREATPENVYSNRREFLKSAGIAALSVITTSANALSEEKVPSLYPATQNKKFVLDRPVTKESVAAQYNNYYEFTDQKDVYRYVNQFKTHPWSIRITGMVKKRREFDIDELIRMMPLEERLYRHRCVEAWAMAVPWTGFAFADLIRLAEPLSSAKFVRMVSFRRLGQAPGQMRLKDQYPFPYYEGLTMQESMNELSFLVTGIYGHPLPVQHGAPFRLAIPWKYGYKSIKGIVEFEFTDRKPRTFWNDVAPKEYDFVSNVNPTIPHPRWSQSTERMIDTGERRPTLPYNGYGEFVADLYV